MAVFRGLFVRKDSTRGTQPAEARKALAGLLVPSSALGARQGILAGPGNPLKVTGTAGWAYQINGGPLVSSRSDADGAVIFGSDGTTPTPAVAAAPGSGSRYDLIYLRHQDVGQGGGETSDATLGVVSGVASGTPVRPTLPAGAVVVAEALVAAGATSTSHANVTITQVLGFTVARGGILPVRNTTELTAAGGFEGQWYDQADTDALLRHDGTSAKEVLRAGAWQSYTPALTAFTTNPTLGPSTLVGYYTLIGKTCHYVALLTIANGFDRGASVWYLSVPVPPNSRGNGTPIGSAIAFNQGARRPLTPILESSANRTYFVRNSNETTVTDAGPGALWAVDDSLFVRGSYEIA